MRSAAGNPAGWSAMPGPDGTGPEVMVPGEPSGTARAAGGITLGVEEEFVLLDPSTGAAVLAGPDLVRMLGGEPGVQQELMRFQVETATPACTSLDDLGRELARLRRLAADAAASLGCRLVASGTAPYRTPGLAAVTDQPRYRKLARRYGPLAVQAGPPESCWTTMRSSRRLAGTLPAASQMHAAPDPRARTGWSGASPHVLRYPCGLPPVSRLPAGLSPFARRPRSPFVRRSPVRSLRPLPGSGSPSVSRRVPFPEQSSR